MTLSGSDTDCNDDFERKENETQNTNETQNKGSAVSVSDHEDGEVSESDDEKEKDDNTDFSDNDSNGSESSSESSSDSEFDDGYDENLMGDEDDRKRLSCLSEKERETEIFKRIEQRDIMRTRWEIEKKLKLARKSEKAKIKPKNDTKKKKKMQKKNEKSAISKEKEKSPAKEEIILNNQKFVESSENVIPITESMTQNESILKSASSDDQINASVEYFDHKERSKERKKNVEMNKTDDKRSNAMALLKAKREGKAKRGIHLNHIYF